MSVPEIRFPEFDGEWKPAKGRNAFGKRSAKGEAGLPIWSVTIDRGLVPRDSLERKSDDAADESNLRALPGDLVYNTMRMWQGAVGRAGEECMLSPAYVVLAPKKDTVSEFFEYWFKAPRMLYRLWAYSHGLTSDRLRLYYDDFGQIPMAMPSKAEQAKIAEFLGALDTRLEGLRRERALLSEYKTGLMQKIFSQDIRFRADDGSAFLDWKEKPLGAVFERVKTRNRVSNDNVLTISAEHGLVSQRDFFNKEIASADTSNYYLLGKNDFAYNKSYSKFYPMGATKRLRWYDAGIVSPLYICFRCKKGQLSDYYEQVFESGLLNRQIYRIAQEGARNHGLLNVSTVDFFDDIVVPVPHPDEQRKIADALGAIDAKIDSVAAQIEKLDAFRQGLLQKLFV